MPSAPPLLLPIPPPPPAGVVIVTGVVATATDAAIGGGVSVTGSVVTATAVFTGVFPLLLLTLLVLLLLILVVLLLLLLALLSLLLVVLVLFSLLSVLVLRARLGMRGAKRRREAAAPPLGSGMKEERRGVARDSISAVKGRQIGPRQHPVLAAPSGRAMRAWWPGRGATAASRPLCGPHAAPPRVVCQYGRVGTC